MNEKLNESQIINTILVLLHRTDIKGAEVQEFINVVEWLQKQGEAALEKESKNNEVNML
jgi:hypothetical protein